MLERVEVGDQSIDNYGPAVGREMVEELRAPALAGLAGEERDPVFGMRLEPGGELEATRGHEPGRGRETRADDPRREGGG